MLCVKVIPIGSCLVTSLLTICYFLILYASSSPSVQQLDASASLVNGNSFFNNISATTTTISNETGSESDYATNAGQLQNRYTGLVRSDIDPDVAKELGLSETNPGVMVIEVIPGSPAEKSSIQGANMTREVGGEIVRLGGDIIVAVDGNASVAKEDEAFIDYLQNEKRVGDNITLTFLRDGKVNETNLTLSSLPDFFWYIDTDEGIKVKYPSDWTVSDSNPVNSHEIVKFFSPEENTELEVATAAVFLNVFPTNGATLDEFAAKQMEGRPQTRMLDIRGTELSELQAYESIFYEYGANRTLKVKSTFTVNEDQLYRINFAADISKYDDYLPMFEEILKSFQITKS